MSAKHQEPTSSEYFEPKLKLKTYVLGYLMSMVLTLTAYLMVTNHGASRDFLIGLLVVLALIQFFVQIYYFLHLGAETKPRWKLAVFVFMTGVVLIIVFGSLWIMNNLNTRMTVPQQIQYMNAQDGI
jgi:cytochrome o ubiquinol oxidase operon protein cyoD